MHDEEEHKQDELGNGPSEESLDEMMDETDEDEDEETGGSFEEESDEKAWE